MTIIDLEAERRRRERVRSSDPSYAEGKFGSAVYHMATSADSLRSRVRDALSTVGPVTEDDMPDDEARELFRDARDLRAREALSDRDVLRLANLICAIHMSLDFYEHARCK